MCDFGPGDQIVCITDRYLQDPASDLPRLIKGRVYVCTSISDDSECCDFCDGTLSVGLEGHESSDWGYCPCLFRKVQRHDLRSWLKTSVPNTDHLDKPLPAKKRERV